MRGTRSWLCTALSADVFLFIHPRMPVDEITLYAISPSSRRNTVPVETYVMAISFLLSDLKLYQLRAAKRSRFRSMTVSTMSTDDRL